MFRRGNFDGDFVELDPFLLEAAAAHLAENLAITGLGGLQRDEHPVGCRFGIVRSREGLLGALGGGFHDANDLVVVAADADVPAEG